MKGAHRLAALLLAACLLACTSSGTPMSEGSLPKEREDAGAPSADFVPPEGLKGLVLCTTPYLDPQRLQRAYRPFADYLQKELKVPVRVEVAQSYDEVGQRMREGSADIGVVSPFAFVRAHREGTGIEPVVNIITDGAATTAGYIVVRADSPIRKLEELRGKRVAFVDKASTTGFLYPLKLLMDRGLDPNSFFGDVSFVGNHVSALMAVREGRYDAAATYQGAIGWLAKWKDVDPHTFRIIAKTERTPNNLVAARSGLPKEVVTALRTRLLSLSVSTAEGRRVLEPIDVNGFVPPLTALYEQIRATDEAVRLRGIPLGKE